MMTPSLPTHAPLASAAKAGRSKRAIAEFLQLQRLYLKKADAALHAGFHFETIGICIHQIHAILRRSLWVSAQNKSLQEHPDAWRDEYLFDMLLETRDDPLAGARDQELYAAAEKFNILPPEESEELRSLFVDAMTGMREAFQGSKAISPDLRKIAERLLAADNRCLTRMTEMFREFEEKIGTLEQRLKR